MNCQLLIEDCNKIKCRIWYEKERVKSSIVYHKLWLQQNPEIKCRCWICGGID